MPERSVICGEAAFYYAELNAKANQVANALKKIGIEKGDKVALSCANLPFFPIIYYGILKTGAVVVPLNILLKSREIAYHLADSDAKAYFCFEGSAELPIGEQGFKGFSQTETCENFVLLTWTQTNTPPLRKTRKLN